MFTGIVREKGTILATRAVPGGLELQIETRLPLSDLALGASVCVSGVCLTVTECVLSEHGAKVLFFVGPETLVRSSLKSASPGAHVNLEPALRLGDSLGGHVVSGHVDGLARLVSSRIEGGVKWMTFSPPVSFMAWIVPQGSVTLAGVSLTLARVDLEACQFSVMVIPHTLEVTTLGRLQEGDEIEIECDQNTKSIVEVVRRVLPGLLESMAGTQK